MAARCAAIFLTMIRFVPLLELAGYDQPLSDSESRFAGAEGGWLAVDGETIVGSALFVRGSDIGLTIDRIFTEPTYRLRGIGRMLLERCIDDAASRDERVVVVARQDQHHVCGRLGLLQTAEADGSVWTHPRLIRHGPVSASAEARRFRYLAHLATDAKGAALQQVMRHIEDLHILAIGTRAFLAWDSFGDHAVIEYMAAARPHRGDGTALIDALRWAVPRLPIVAITDDDAVGFYRSYGFSVAPAPADDWDRRRFVCTFVPD